MDLLLKGELHPRAIADRLGTNHMTVIRTLNRLADGNVVDFRIAGKNKIYFLKRTLEGRNAVMTAEYYKLSKAAGRYPELRGIIRAVQEMAGLPLAVLFGSYAKGTAKADSDIDLFLETRDRKMKKDLQTRHSRLSVKLGEFDVSGLLAREMVKDHVILKGVERFYERTGFFKEGSAVSRSWILSSRTRE
jgi:predicted nucleotidyltransferase